MSGRQSALPSTRLNYLQAAEMFSPVFHAVLCGLFRSGPAASRVEPRSKKRPSQGNFICCAGVFLCTAVPREIPLQVFTGIYGYLQVFAGICRYFSPEVQCSGARMTGTSVCQAHCCTVFLIHVCETEIITTCMPGHFAAGAAIKQALQ